jgi:hypothetical protein
MNRAEHMRGDRQKVGVTDKRSTCVVCGSSFTARRGAKTCSPGCRQKFYRERVTDVGPVRAKPKEDKTITKGNSMTKGDRAELGKVLKYRAKVAKGDIENHAGRILANIEAQLAAVYPENHAAWADVTEHTRQLIADADTQIAERCRKLGIPEQFRPSIDFRWYGRGENAIKDRRAELRKVAQMELAARVKAAKNAVDRRTADLLTQLAVDMLESSQAKDFLNAMPSVDDLMPPITLDDLKAIAPPFTLGEGW